MKVALRGMVAVCGLVTSSACVSIVPAGAFEYGRGASAMADNTTRIQIGGGGGGAVGTAGAGASARLEHQLNPDVSVGIDVGSGFQYSTVGVASVSVFPTCGYLTAQVNPGRTDTFAVRVKIGGGTDTITPNSAGSITVPYLAGSLEAVLSPPKAKDAALDPYLAIHGGLRASLVGSALAAANGGAASDAISGLLLSVAQANVGIRAGTALHLSPNFALYASVDMDGLVLVVPVGFVPDLYADAQAGLAFTF